MLEFVTSNQIKLGKNILCQIKAVKSVVVNNEHNYYSIPEGKLGGYVIMSNPSDIKESNKRLNDNLVNSWIDSNSVLHCHTYYIKDTLIKGTTLTGNNFTLENCSFNKSNVTNYTISENTTATIYMHSTIDKSELNSCNTILSSHVSKSVISSTSINYTTVSKSKLSYCTLIDSNTTQLEAYNSKLYGSSLYSEFCNSCIFRGVKYSKDKKYILEYPVVIKTSCLDIQLLKDKPAQIKVDSTDPDGNSIKMPSLSMKLLGAVNVFLDPSLKELY